jgi:hypothetical protein
MAKLICAAFLLGLKAERDAEIKAKTIQAIGENLQGQVVAYATQGKRFIQVDVTNTANRLDFEKFLDENMPEVFTAVTTDYFDKSVKIEVKKMLKNPVARGDEPLWVDIDDLPLIHHLRSGWQEVKHIFEITW